MYLEHVLPSLITRERDVYSLFKSPETTSSAFGNRSGRIKLTVA